MARERVPLSGCLGRDTPQPNKDPHPMNKLTLQALALTGILAVSGLPALAAEMTPTAPTSTPSASVDTKAKTSVDQSKSTAAKKAHKSSKTVAKNSKEKVHQQTAQ